MVLPIERRAGPRALIGRSASVFRIFASNAVKQGIAPRGFVVRPRPVGLALAVPGAIGRGARRFRLTLARLSDLPKVDDFCHWQTIAAPGEPANALASIGRPVSAQP